MITGAIAADQPMWLAAEELEQLVDLAGTEAADIVRRRRCSAAKGRRARAC